MGVRLSGFKSLTVQSYDLETISQTKTDMDNQRQTQINKDRQTNRHIGHFPLKKEVRGVPLSRFKSLTVL